MLVDVVKDAALAVEFAVQRRFAGPGLRELVAQILVGLFEALAAAEVPSEGVADQEAERGRK